MPTPDEVARIKREVAMQLVDEFENGTYYLPLSHDQATAMRAYVAREYPAPPKRVRAEVQFGSFWARIVPDGWLEIGSDKDAGPDVSLRRSDIAELTALDARADAEGFVEEGLGQRDPNSDARSETKPSEPSPAPAPAPAETGEWWLVLSNHDLRPLCVYPTQERARRVALELLGSGCEAESLSVVPRAALNAMREERDAAGRRLQALQPVVAEVIREKDEAKAQLREATEERDRLAVAVDCALSPFGVEFMDPPDGGNVEPDEQLRRMANALVDTRAQLREATRERDYARQEAEFWNTQSKKRHGERDEARAQLAAAERELEGVRKVEAYMKRIRNRVERRGGKPGEVAQAPCQQEGRMTPREWGEMLERAADEVRTSLREGVCDGCDHPTCKRDREEADTISAALRTLAAAMRAAYRDDASDPTSYCITLPQEAP